MEIQGFSVFQEYWIYWDTLGMQSVSGVLYILGYTRNAECIRSIGYIGIHLGMQSVSGVLDILGYTRNTACIRSIGYIGIYIARGA